MLSHENRAGVAVTQPYAGASSLSKKGRANPRSENSARGLLSKVLLASCLVTASATTSGAAQNEDKTLKLYFGNTGERAIITYKRNGVFDQNGLAQLNHFLRDWRRNETIRMDPRLFDIVWEMYRRSGARDYINVVSGYRSPNTNAMLRSRSSGVAKESQHTRGKAIDFFIPGVNLATLRAIGMQMQGGGVGYYPRSASPFVHIDVGGVRAWPRMSHQELAKLFPDGRTLHLPSDGRPLAGYAEAVAEYKRRGSLSTVSVASLSTETGSRKRSLFRGADAEEAKSTAGARASAVAGTTPNSMVVSSPVTASGSADAVFAAPVPAMRPSDSVLLAMLPVRPEEVHKGLLAATSGNEESDDLEDEVLVPSGAIPVPTFASRASEERTDDEIVTASIEPQPEYVKVAPFVPRTGAVALLIPASVTGEATAHFAKSYETANFVSRTFSHATSGAFDSNRFGDDPCPPMTANTGRQAIDQPC